MQRTTAQIAPHPIPCVLQVFSIARGLARLEATFSSTEELAAVYYGIGAVREIAQDETLVRSHGAMGPRI